MFDVVPVPTKPLEPYRAVVGDATLGELRALAAPLRGARVLHLNATAFGGGVAEILGTLVSLMRAVGLETEWQTMRGAHEFFNVTKAMHNALQGADIPFTDAMYETWKRYNAENARLFDADYDFVIIHDPQPAGILAMLDRPRVGKWIWRCHIDLTDAQPAAWNFLRPYLAPYDAAIFSMPEYVKPDLAGPEVFVIPPSIDPLSPKNMALPRDMVREIVRRYNVDADRPLLVQVSRFDPWKDPLGVIDAYRIVKREIPDVQLALLAGMATDDPEGWAWYEKVARYAGLDEDLEILSNLNGIGNTEVNAFQRAADVCIQKSLREGFGLTVSEALYKGRPTIGGNVGGIRIQIQDGETGFLVDSVAECADRCLQLLRDPALGERLGAAGHAYVRDHFLSTADLREHLQLFQSVATSAGTPATSR